MHDLSNNMELDSEIASIIQTKLSAQAGKVLSYSRQMSLYQKEEGNASRELDRLRDTNADSSDITEAENKLFNAGQMLPAAQSRLATAASDLRALIKTAIEYLPSDDDALQRALKVSNSVKP
ncbi:hypothetical protein FRB90_009125 [Tulasnella sp. 427]|nr:hypothetical protein FRB90_009125 [Tulasnella sp. 427]